MLSVNLGIDAQVNLISRFVVLLRLPAGAGKRRTCCSVYLRRNNADAAKEAGADFVGMEELSG